jgi:DNA-binding winged helix-turn-helix (wHTH) protein
VTRDEIQRELWPGDTFVDFEGGLNSCIKQIRRALGDDAREPRYLETLPRRGYRFIAVVELGEAGGAKERSRPRRWGRNLAPVLAALAFLLAVALYLVRAVIGSARERG